MPRDPKVQDKQLSEVAPAAVQGVARTGWADLLPLHDETWHVEVDDGLRREGYVANGRTPDEAMWWAGVSGQANAEIVARTPKTADVLTDIGSHPSAPCLESP